MHFSPNMQYASLRQDISRSTRTMGLILSVNADCINVRCLSTFHFKMTNAEQVMGLWTSEEMAIFATSGGNHRNWARFHKLSGSAKLRPRKRTSFTKKIHIYTYRGCCTRDILVSVRPILGRFWGHLSSLIIHEMKIFQFCHLMGRVVTHKWQKAQKI